MVCFNLTIERYIAGFRVLRAPSLPRTGTSGGLGRCKPEFWVNVEQNPSGLSVTQHLEDEVTPHDL